MTTPDILDAVGGAIDRAAALGVPRATTIELRDRLEAPLRVAIAGRIKAGKSTLLNALVGERLAATDAGECTKIVTWYRRGIGYEVRADLRGGSAQPLRFRRDRGRLEISLSEEDLGAVERIVVDWPTRRLDAMTLIDTPGLDPAGAAGSGEETDWSDHGAADADAVIYLIRHLHRTDARFLETFAAGGEATGSPINSIAVLSRADEIGSGRADALESAAAIAARLARDELLRARVATVLPLAGLLAETGSTLTEAEYADLAAVAGLDASRRGELLLSVDRFADMAAPVPGAARCHLVERLGLFGVRMAITGIAEGRIDSAPALAAALIEASGLGPLVVAIEDWLGRRARVLKARSILGRLRGHAAELAQVDPASASELGGAIERVEAASIEFAYLRLSGLTDSGTTELSEGEIAEIRLLCDEAPDAVVLGSATGPPPEDVAAGLLAAVERWRRRAAGPLNLPATTEACELAVRCYEHRYVRRLGA